MKQKLTLQKLIDNGFTQEYKILRWYFEEGDYVKWGEILCEIETVAGKAEVELEVELDRSGIISDLRKVGEENAYETPLCEIETNEKKNWNPTTHPLF